MKHPRTMTTSMIMPATAPLWRRNWRHTSERSERNSPQVGGCGHRGDSVPSSGPIEEISVIANPGIEEAVQHVGDDVEHDGQDGEDEHERLHHR